MDGTDECRRILDELRKPKGPPETLRLDDETTCSRILRHRSGFPPKIRAAIRDARFASADPNDDHRDDVLARPDLFRQTVRTAIEEFMYGPSTEDSSNSNSNDDVDCTKEQLEVVLRSYPHVLPMGEKLPPFFLWCPLYRLIRCRERLETDDYRELLSVVAKLGIDLGEFKEYQRNYIGMICLVEPTMRMLEQIKRDPPREDLKEAFSETYDELAAAMMETLLETRVWMDSRDVADFNLVSRLVFQANKDDSIDSRLRCLVDANPGQLTQCLRNCCTAQPNDDDDDDDEHVRRFERVFALGMRRYPDRLGRFGSLYGSACSRFGTERIHRMVCDEVPGRLSSPDSTRDPKMLVVAAASSGAANPPLSRAVVYALLRRDPVAVLVTE